MTWTIDLDTAWPATLAPLPDGLAAAVNEALARPAAQQLTWPDPEVARVRGVLENLEIVSPDDDSWKKLTFYAAHQADELLIVDPEKRRVDWLGLEPAGEYAPTERSHLIELGPQSWPSGSTGRRRRRRPGSVSAGLIEQPRSLGLSPDAGSASPPSRLV